jgi:dihydrofolate reductase
MAASDALLLGRVTYQEFAEFWPYQEGFIADYINATPKYVVSNTLDEVHWQHTSIISGNVGEELAHLKKQPGKAITTTGSATLIQSLLRGGLLDELQLMIPPIVAGSGKHLFADDSEQKILELIDARTFKTGVLYVTYRPAAGQTA